MTAARRTLRAGLIRRRWVSSSTWPTTSAVRRCCAWSPCVRRSRAAASSWRGRWTPAGRRRSWSWDLQVSGGARQCPARRACPQTLLLRRCDLFVTHGGFNRVKEALTEGAPMVVLPVSADQPYCAQRCADLGLAVTVSGDDRTPMATRDAARSVLGDPSFKV